MLDEPALVESVRATAGLVLENERPAAEVRAVRLSREAATLRVVVADDGVGGARPSANSGLAGLRDRLEALDAKLEVDSEPGRGTSISAEIPCGS